jgi:predicted dehydrogenase
VYAVSRIGILGAGWIAADHAAVLSKREDVEVVAVCDLEPSRAEHLAPPGATVYERWEELIEHEPVDALWVCLPPLHHRQPTVDALGRGIHVYLEKPIARSSEDGDAIVAAAEDSIAVCAVGYQWHATEVLDDLHRALDGQAVSLVAGRSIGPTGSRPWFLDRAQGGGNVLERGSHQIDLARAIAGEVVHVQAAASSVPLAQATGERGDIEDAATLLLQHASGALTTIVVAWSAPGQPSTYEVDVAASDATLRLTLDPEFSLAGVSRGEEVSARSTEHPFERSIARFLEAARAGDKRAVFCTPSDAARTLAVANACEHALATGDTVAV